jgi:hypothetical protein
MKTTKQPQRGRPHNENEKLEVIGRILINEHWNTDSALVLRTTKALTKLSLSELNDIELIIANRGEVR